MSGKDRTQVWAAGDKYEPYVGRWSRLVAADFLRWVGVGDGKRWVDVGCGTGALTQTILATRNPALVVGVDRSERYLRHAGDRTHGEQVVFAASDGQALPLASEMFDVAVSGLVVADRRARCRFVESVFVVLDRDHPGLACVAAHVFFSSPK